MNQDNVHRNFGGQAQPGDVAPYVLLASSKDRVRKVVSHWTSARQVADHYEFLLYSGEYAGRRISCCSTGIGGMSVAIAVEELAALQASTFLRVGVTRPLVDEQAFGQLTIAKGAVRWDGTSHDYVRPEYPALAHFEVVLAAISAAENLGFAYQVGIIGDLASSGPESSDGYRHFLTRRMAPYKQELYEAGVLNGTGESATMFVQSSIYGLRAGTIHVNAYDPEGQHWDPAADDKVVLAGLETMRILMEWDQMKQAQGVPYITPALA
ncbi:MAG: nucleoside phosphorylase [Chloroflexi bacterium]|jgi:uridine phosphorylase|nr:nucleoside phosphorylase [Chloroflexota bacterium]